MTNSLLSLGERKKTQKRKQIIIAMTHYQKMLECDNEQWGPAVHRIVVRSFFLLLQIIVVLIIR